MQEQFGKPVTACNAWCAPESWGSLTMGHRLDTLRMSLAGLAVAFGLSACASAPRGLLQPVEPVAGTDRVNMLAATTRAPSAEAGVLFSGERGDAVSFSNIVVSIPKQV